MKKLYTSKLQLNKVTNVLKYIVLIMGFIVCGYIKNSSEVLLAGCSAITSNKNDISCEAESGVDNDKVHIRVLSSGGYLQIKVCDYGTEINCTNPFTIMSFISEDKLLGYDVEIYKKQVTAGDGKARNLGEIWYDYYHCDNTFWGICTSSKEWKGYQKYDNVNISNHITDNGKSLESPLSLYLFTTDIDGKMSSNSYFKARMDLDAWSFKYPEINFEVDNESFEKIHAVSVSGRTNGDYTIEYSYLQSNSSSATNCNAGSVKNTKLIHVPKVEGQTNTSNLNGTYYFGARVVDSSGRSKFDFIELKYDNDGPTLVDSTVIYVDDFAREYEASEREFEDDGIGVDYDSIEYCWVDSGTFTNSSKTCITNETDLWVSTLSSSSDDAYVYLYVRASDKLGNSNGWVLIEGVKLDNTKPVLLIGMGGSSEWKTELDSFVVTLYDSLSGFVDTEYEFEYCWQKAGESCSFDNSMLPTESGSIEVYYPEDTGEYYLKIKAYDRLGNETDEIVSDGTYSVDNTGPDDPEKKCVTVDEKTGSTVPTISYDCNAVKQAHNVVLSSSDTGQSGVNRIEYCWYKSGNVKCELNPTFKVTNGGSVTKSTGDGTYVLRVRSVDNVGNPSDIKEYSFKFDNTAPKININWKPNAAVQSVEVVSDNVVMSYDVDEVIEVYEENEELIEEVIGVEKVKDQDILMMASNEVVNVNHVHVPDRVSVYDYIISLNSSVVVGSYLFVKERKRINVS